MTLPEKCVNDFRTALFRFRFYYEMALAPDKNCWSGSPKRDVDLGRADTTCLIRPQIGARQLAHGWLAEESSGTIDLFVVVGQYEAHKPSLHASVYIMVVAVPGHRTKSESRFLSLKTKPLPVPTHHENLWMMGTSLNATLILSQSYQIHQIGAQTGGRSSPWPWRPLAGEGFAEATFLLSQLCLKGKPAFKRGCRPAICIQMLVFETSLHSFKPVLTWPLRRALTPLSQF